jgi:hypothetical protein
MKIAAFACAVLGVLSAIVPARLSAADASGQVAPATSTVTVPATAGSRNPVKIGKVTAGQKVTLVIGHVLWKGGGSKTGDSADWRGYRGRKEGNGLPWMALVAAVGKQNFLPDKKEFTFAVTTEGELVLFANDGNPDGNSGKGEVTVKVE